MTAIRVLLMALLAMLTTICAQGATMVEYRESGVGEPCGTIVYIGLFDNGRDVVLDCWGEGRGYDTASVKLGFRPKTSVDSIDVALSLRMSADFPIEEKTGDPIQVRYFFSKYERDEDDRPRRDQEMIAGEVQSESWKLLRKDDKNMTVVKTLKMKKARELVDELAGSEKLTINVGPNSGSLNLETFSSVRDTGKRKRAEKFWGLVEQVKPANSTP